MPVVETSVVDGHIGIIRINRLEQKNALSPEVVVRYARAMKAFAADSDIRVIIVTGSGDVFCSGADLGKLIPLVTGARKASDEWDTAYLDDMAQLDVVFGKGYDCGKPLIAAVNGLCLAGGFEIMLTADIRVAAAGARFALREAAVGLVPGGGGTARLPREVPPAVAMEVLMTADFFTAERMHAVGIINHVEPTGDAAVATAIRIARTIAANSPHAVAQIRSCARAVRGMTEAAALEREGEASIAVMSHPDAREGPRAFKEKRAPKWAKL